MNTKDMTILFLASELAQMDDQLQDEMRCREERSKRIEVIEEKLARRDKTIDEAAAVLRKVRAEETTTRQGVAEALRLLTGEDAEA